MNFSDYFPRFIEFRGKDCLDLGFTVITTSEVETFGIVPRDGRIGIFIRTRGKDIFFSIPGDSREEEIRNTVVFYQELRRVFFGAEFNFTSDGEEALENYIFTYGIGEDIPEPEQEFGEDEDGSI